VIGPGHERYGLSGLGEGDGEAERLDLPDVVAELAVGIGAGLVRAASSLTWNYATGAGPGARTGSDAPRTPGCATCPCTAMRRTSCGTKSSPWPANSSPGPSCSPSLAPPADGNQNGRGSCCSPPPGASSAAADACGSASPPAGFGPRTAPCRNSHTRPLWLRVRTGGVCRSYVPRACRRGRRSGGGCRPGGCAQHDRLRLGRFRASPPGGTIGS
jgi:hypothetical protein